MSTVDKQVTDQDSAAAAVQQIELHDVRLTITDGYATLRLGRPDEAMVTLTEARIEQIEATIEQLIRHDGLRGMIVTGPGPDMFCAGADVNLIRDITDASKGKEAAVRGQSVFAKLQNIKVPVVSAIEGPCLGGGFELALFCDVRIASDAKSTQISIFWHPESPKKQVSS